MKRSPRDPTVSLLFDREASQELEALRRDPEVEAELGELRRLSAALTVPRAVAQPDPFFVARFRARREAMRQTSQSALEWRRMALRLLPLAASALLAAALSVWSSEESTSALGELEMTDLGNGVPDVTIASAFDEPVLRIALGEL